ncbi:MAG: T9SS type A sorting domain-containing protein [Bacteroidetes bacterium]|nr:T9SS type A sorting domain-containing protein [Bacteroidota bacterium]
MVKENNIHNTTGINASTMDVSMLPKGVYVLSAINNKGTVNKRVVIE